MLPVGIREDVRHLFTSTSLSTYGGLCSNPEQFSILAYENISFVFFRDVVRYKTTCLGYCAVHTVQHFFPSIVGKRNSARCGETSYSCIGRTSSLDENRRLDLYCEGGYPEWFFPTLGCPLLCLSTHASPSYVDSSVPCPKNYLHFA